jgi:hypothetical protein
MWSFSAGSRGSTVTVYEREVEHCTRERSIRHCRLVEAAIDVCLWAIGTGNGRSDTREKRA